MFRTHLLAGAAAPCLLLAMPAAAQAQDASSVTSVADTAPSWTGDIIVTGARETYTAPETSAATRTDTPLIQVPQSVQVLTKTLIQEQDRRTLDDALFNVSGATPTRVDEVLFIPPIVRGFPAEVYLDGLSVFAGNQQAYDPNSLVGIERIDVLKGPTATLYGGGIGTPLGGVINLESVRPNDKPGGYKSAALAISPSALATWPGFKLASSFNVVSNSAATLSPCHSLAPTSVKAPSSSAERRLIRPMTSQGALPPESRQRRRGNRRS